VHQDLPDGEEAVDVELLWSEADGVPRRPVVVLDVVAEHLGGPAGLAHEADECLDERRLPSAIRAEQSEERALGDGQREAVERPDVPVLLDEVVGAYRRWHWLGGSRVTRLSVPKRVSAAP